ncbi:hypothetical protein Pfo_026854 [Paulownia fortunei]|nr:hypothetical protein Pfo_026854 [Paulownia fortunei]
MLFRFLKDFGNKEEWTSMPKVVQDESEDLNDSDYDLESKSNNDKLYHENIDDEAECEYGEEDVMKSNDDLNSTKGSDNEENRHNFSVFNPIELYDLSFELWILFSTKTKLRQTIHSHCDDKECGWKLHALKPTGECTFQIRKYDPNHSCGVSFHVKNLKFNWLCGKYVQKVKSDPERNVKGFKINVMNDIKCHISNYQADRAKRKDYSLLWDYADEIKRTNPCTTIIIRTKQSSGKNRFDRFYDFEYAFMSDKQKGLIQAIEEMFPNLDHKFYIRHVHSNFEKGSFRSQAFNSALWNTCRATTRNEFRRRIKKMRDLDESTAEWFNDKLPQHWNRSHFTNYCKCDVLLNNRCESFNSNILDARDKLIVSMCEWKMKYLMQSLQTNRDRA